MSLCDVPGCGRSATTYGRLCPKHAARQRRHGDATQATIPLSALEGPLATIAYWQRKKPGNPVWAAAVERWAGFVDICREEIAAMDRKGVWQRDDRRAAQEVLKIAESAKPEEVWKRVAAVVMLRESRPTLFVSDRAFDFQLVRLFRQLGDLSFGQSWNHKTGKTKRHYRDLPPSVSERLGEDLRKALGVVGLQLHRVDVAQAEAQRKRAEEEREGFAELMKAAEEVE